MLLETHCLCLFVLLWDVHSTRHRLWSRCCSSVVKSGWFSSIIVAVSPSQGPSKVGQRVASLVDLKQWTKTPTTRVFFLSWWIVGVVYKRGCGPHVIFLFLSLILRKDRIQNRARGPPPAASENIICLVRLLCLDPFRLNELMLWNVKIYDPTCWGLQPTVPQASFPPVHTLRVDFNEVNSHSHNNFKLLPQLRMRPETSALKRLSPVLWVSTKLQPQLLTWLPPALLSSLPPSVRLKAGLLWRDIWL